MTTKPLYLLIKLDVDGEIVFDYKDAENYAKNFCNNMEFELIDHCLEETENNDLYIGCDPIKKLHQLTIENEEERDLTDEEIWNGADLNEVWP